MKPLLHPDVTGKEPFLKGRIAVTLEEANETRQALLRQVVTAVNAVNVTNQQYATANLFPPGINPQPILYFADPITAEFATFGVNPAARINVESMA